MADAAFTCTKEGKTEIVGRQKVTRTAIDITNYNSTTAIVPTAAQLGLKKITRLEVHSRESLTKYPVWNGLVGSSLKISMVNVGVDPGAEVATDVDCGVIEVIAYGV